MQKKSKFFAFLIAGTMAAGLISCGGSGSSGGKKLADNAVFGDLPNIMYQKHLTDSIIEVEEKAALGKLNPMDKGDWAKGEKIKEKFNAEEKEADNKYDAEIEKIKAQLVGKDIPFEVEDGLGYKINFFKITKVDGSGVSAEFEVEITDVKAANISRYGNLLDVVWQIIDNNGNQMTDYDSSERIPLPEKAENAIVKASTYIQIMAAAEQNYYVDFAKIKFVKEKK